LATFSKSFEQGRKSVDGKSEKIEKSFDKEKRVCYKHQLLRSAVRNGRCVFHGEKEVEKKIDRQKVIW